MFLALTQDIALDHVIPLAQYNCRVSIVNTGIFTLLSNICPHQNSRIAKCATKHLQCPYHGMTFDRDGSGLNNSYSLEKWSTYQNQTILFDQHVGCRFPIDTRHMTLAEHRQDTVNATPDVIMDVFLDIEHIPVAHTGVYDQIGITDVEEITWHTFENGSIQFVSPQGKTNAIKDDEKYNIGACWMAVYPGTMIEWQPGALFVTVAHNTTETSSQVQVYKYKDTRYDDSVWTLNNHVWETAWTQDRVLAEFIESPAVDNLDELKQHHRVWMQDAV